MNIGPQPNGELPAVAVERLKGVGIGCQNMEKPFMALLQEM